MQLSLFAPAKINLYLHVVGRRSDGYHLLDSLVAFADIGDTITAGPASELSLTVAGPEAAALSGVGGDNLVLRAARLLAETAGVRTGARLHLDKRLPVSSGVGGGSSDAAATLRLLNAMWGQPLGQAALAEIALRLGADTPACLAAEPVWVSGIGECLEPAPRLYEAGVVLANSRHGLATPSVFAARSGAFSEAGRFDQTTRDAAALAAALAARRNDLTVPALSLVPEIAAVLAALAAAPGVLLARMSGSGATCFGLFADRSAALAAGKLLARQEPDWWIAMGALLTAPPPIQPAQPFG